MFQTKKCEEQEILWRVFPYVRGDAIQGFAFCLDDVGKMCNRGKPSRLCVFLLSSFFFALFFSDKTSTHSLLCSFLYACTPPYPLYPHKNGFKTGGKFIRSKNKHVSASVLLPCRVPQGCTALWMSLVFLPCPWSTGTHMHNAHQRTHILSKGHSEAVITSILQLCYCCYPLSSQSGLGPFLWVREQWEWGLEPSSNKVPSPITQLLSLNTSLLHYLLYLVHTVSHQ